MNGTLANGLRTDRSLAFRLAGAATTTPRALLLLLHGVGGNETNLAPLADQIGDDARIILPRGPLTLGAGQHAWFEVAFGPQGPRPDVAAAENSRLRLAAFIAELQAEFGMTPSRTVVAGFSQGGIMSASVGLTRPDLVAGFGVLAGRILPELEPRLADGEALARVQAFIGHGRDDTKLPVEWAHRSDAWLTRLGVPHETRLYPGNHGVSPAMQDDFLKWFGRVTNTASI